MSNISLEDRIQHGLLSVVTRGLPAVVGMVPAPPLQVAEIQEHQKAWLDRRPKNPNVTPNPIVHVYMVADNSDVCSVIIVDEQGTRYNYSDFAALGTDNGFNEWFRQYLVDNKKRLLDDDRARQIFKPRPLANATLVITADDKMMCVKRDTGMHLHPEYLHCNGGKVKPVAPGETINLVTDALERVHIETAIPLQSFAVPTYWGLSSNTPEEVIALFTVRTSLTAAEINEIYPKADKPDGKVVYYDYSAQRLELLLKAMPTTPSFHALLFLLHHSMT